MLHMVLRVCTSVLFIFLGIAKPRSYCGSFSVLAACSTYAHTRVIAILVAMNQIYTSSFIRTGSMDVFCVARYGGASSESRDRLIINKSIVDLKDDAGQLLSSHPDWDEETYAEIIKAFSEEDDHVYLPRIVTGKE